MKQRWKAEEMELRREDWGYRTPWLRYQGTETCCKQWARENDQEVKPRLVTRASPAFDLHTEIRMTNTLEVSILPQNVSVKVCFGGYLAKGSSYRMR